MKIIIVAFNDSTDSSVNYRKCDSIKKAAELYAQFLENPNIHTISTRIVRKK